MTFACDFCATFWMLKRDRQLMTRLNDLAFFGPRVDQRSLRTNSEVHAQLRKSARAKSRRKGGRGTCSGGQIVFNTTQHVIAAPRVLLVSQGRLGNGGKRAPKCKPETNRHSKKWKNKQLIGKF